MTSAGTTMLTAASAQGSDCGPPPRRRFLITPTSPATTTAKKATPGKYTGSWYRNR